MTSLAPELRAAINSAVRPSGRKVQPATVENGLKEHRLISINAWADSARHTSEGQLVLKKIEGALTVWLEELPEKPRSPRARLDAAPVASSRPPITPSMFTDDEVTRPTLLPAELARADWLDQQPGEEDYELL